MPGYRPDVDEMEEAGMTEQPQVIGMASYYCKYRDRLKKATDGQEFDRVYNELEMMVDWEASNIDDKEYISKINQAWKQVEADVKSGKIERPPNWDFPDY